MVWPGEFRPLCGLIFSKQCRCVSCDVISLVAVPMVAGERWYQLSQRVFVYRDDGPCLATLLRVGDERARLAENVTFRLAAFCHRDGVTGVRRLRAIRLSKTPTHPSCGMGRMLLLK